MEITPILFGFIALILVVSIFLLVMSKLRGGSFGSGKASKWDRDAIITNAHKRLSQNPHDVDAMYALGSAYFENEDWDKAFKTFENLVNKLHSSTVRGVDSFEIFLKYGVSARKLNMVDHAYKAFSSARMHKQNNFEVNYELGILEFERKNYEKAVQLLQQARAQEPESPAVLRYLGHAFFRMKRPKEAMNYIRKAIDLAPDDKESLYTLAECYHEAKQVEQALRIYNHLRADPVMGPNSCLIAGSIRLETRQYEAAIQDFEIGLRHPNIKIDILTELRYKLAVTYLKINEISKAIALLKQIQTENASYKDINVLLSKYMELNSNRNLQVFLMSSSADFIALCRRVVMSYYVKQRAKVKILDITVNKNEWADILAEVDTPKWTGLIMFRFIRTQGSIGELVVRDFHSHLKEVKASKGICMTVGMFTEEAKRYTEARLIDLIERERLQAILNSVDAKAASMRK